MSRRNVTLLGGFVICFLALSLTQAVEGSQLKLKPRAATTTAVCADAFDWMDNSLHQSPCLVAAYLQSSCNGEAGWNVEALQSDHYPSANISVVNVRPCRCSWSVYNALQACSICQGHNTISWNTHHAACTGKMVSDTLFYPSGIVIDQETAIPFWTITNPTTWSNGTFNVTEAENIANEAKPDITQLNREGGSGTSSTTTSKSKVNTGAIVAGSLAGFACLTIGLLAYLFVRKRRFRRTKGGRPKTPISPLVIPELLGVHGAVRGDKSTSETDTVNNRITSPDLMGAEGHHRDRNQHMGQYLRVSNVDDQDTIVRHSSVQSFPPPYTPYPTPKDAR